MQKPTWAQTLRSSTRKVKLITRFILSAVTFVLGFVFSYSSFFRDNPLYQIPYLAEALISITAAFIGFYIIPEVFLKMLEWFETLIVNTITAIVWSFWEEQTRRINENKRKKQKELARIEKAKQKSDFYNAVLLDTSVLVDGRVLNIVKTGFLQNNLILLNSVLNELHLISDNPDKLKRERGRRGLHVVSELKKIAQVVTPSLIELTTTTEVDKILVAFAKKHSLSLMTQDYNLKKLAEAAGIKVLNINELVEAVKLSALPGELLQIEISQTGREKNQGVGYMPDGTMIVVEGAEDKVGQKIDVTVTKVIQKDTGKIIFAR